MVRKRFGLLVLISAIFLLVIAGCGRGGDDTISAASPFLGGSQGLEIKFLPGSPPDEITNTNFPFQAIVGIKNVGEYDITKYQVRADLSGVLASDFGSNLVITNINPADNPTSRKKDSEGNIIEAVETFATIPLYGNLQLGADKISGNTKLTFRADVCYQYQTGAIGSICVLNNMVDVADNAICNPKGSRAISSSGSPVKVTSFRQSVVGQNKIQFSFDIIHSGNGNVFENKIPTATAGCPKDPSIKRNEENKLDVTVATGIPQTLTCVGIGSGTGTVTSNNVRLVDGKRTITCTQEVPASDFERNVDISIKFNYLGSIDKEVLAKKLESGTTTQPAITLTANPTQITLGSGQQYSTLSWSTANAQSCTASSSTGTWSGTKVVPGGSTSGQETVIPLQTTTYALTCTSSGGTQSSLTTIYVVGITGACGTLTAPRDIRSQIIGTTTSIQTCPMLNSAGITDAFLISTPNGGPAVLQFSSTLPANAYIGFAVRKDSCSVVANECSASSNSPQCSFTAVAGSTYCVVTNSQQANSPNTVVTFSLTRP